MAISAERLVAELRAFQNRGEVIKAMKAGIRKPVPAVRKKIRANALGTLPKGGGLNEWVSKIRINVEVKLTGYKRVGIRLKGGRNSKGARSDVNAIDRGRVRAPSWGHRTAASWHSQTVPAGFFTKPASEASEWREAVDAEIDHALDQIRRG